MLTITVYFICLKHFEANLSEGFHQQKGSKAMSRSGKDWIEVNVRLGCWGNWQKDCLLAPIYY